MGGGMLKLGGGSEEGTGSTAMGMGSTSLAGIVMVEFPLASGAFPQTMALGSPSKGSIS